MTLLLAIGVLSDTVAFKTISQIMTRGTTVTATALNYWMLLPVILTIVAVYLHIIALIDYDSGRVVPAYGLLCMDTALNIMVMLAGRECDESMMVESPHTGLWITMRPAGRHPIDNPPYKQA